MDKKFSPSKTNAWSIQLSSRFRWMANPEIGDCQGVPIFLVHMWIIRWAPLDVLHGELIKSMAS